MDNSLSALFDMVFRNMAYFFCAAIEIIVGLKFMLNCKKWQRMGMIVCGVLYLALSIFFFVLQFGYVFMHQELMSRELIDFARFVGTIQTIAFGFVLYFAARSGQMRSNA